ncbi:MAG: hypothetical protein RJQ01_00630 [Microcella sp.]|uniref:hypothetical protein n=1 Tax=Microcella sp. TaxID=1913979 RepID=UPI00331631DC
MDGDGDGEAAASAVADERSAGGPTAGGSRSDESSQVAEADDALLSRLALIGERPLADRAAAFRQLHDELRSELDATDTPSTEPTRPA